MSKVISVEDMEPSQSALRNVLRMVPDRDKNDINLQRLLAFRLRTDGESALRHYLMQKIRAAIRCAYTGSLYDFIKNDLHEKECRAEISEPSDPGAA